MFRRSTAGENTVSKYRKRLCIFVFASTKGRRISTKKSLQARQSSQLRRCSWLLCKRPDRCEAPRSLSLPIHWSPICLAANVNSTKKQKPRRTQPRHVPRAHAWTLATRGNSAHAPHAAKPARSLICQVSNRYLRRALTFPVSLHPERDGNRDEREGAQCLQLAGLRGRGQAESGEEGFHDRCAWILLKKRRLR